MAQVLRSAASNLKYMFISPCGSLIMLLIITFLSTPLLLACMSKKTVY